MKIKTYRIPFAVFLLISFASGSLLIGANPAKMNDSLIPFTDIGSQTKTFIGYYHSIQLTPQQKRIEEEALKAISAPCCKDFSALTCCCPCNFAKSIWGLSNYLVAKKHATPAQVQKAVKGWIAFTHPHGDAGDACAKGRCQLPTSQDGCAGMNEQDIVL